MSHFDRYINQNLVGIRVSDALRALLSDTKDALIELPRWERAVHSFWLIGPFILLIERTPADIWLSMLSLTFVIRSIVKRDTSWLGVFWVKAGFLFWFWCLLSGAMSYDPVYSISEAFIWFRFPLLAMATAFWLATDKRLIYAMLLSITMGMLIMCFILIAEILIVWQPGHRLSWPYGDLVPGNYLAKATLPVFTILVALAVSIKARVGVLSATVALFSILVSVLTGERINFLIRACGGMLAGLVWQPIWPRYLALIAVELSAIALVLISLPEIGTRFTGEFIKGAFDFQTSGWHHTVNGGLVIAKDNLLFGIGPGNFRFLSPELLDGVAFTRPDNHPHNYYSQMLAETGVLGLFLGVIFLGAITWTCFKVSLGDNKNVFKSTAWVTPFGLFWPIATTADFFGQWNNIFMWSSIAIATACISMDKKALKSIKRAKNTDTR